MGAGRATTQIAGFDGALSLTPRVGAAVWRSAMSVSDPRTYTHNPRPCPQDALALPSGDQQGQVAEAHRRTTLAMTELRSTLRDEHHCLLQVCIRRCPRRCRQSP